MTAPSIKGDAYPASSRVSLAACRPSAPEAVPVLRHAATAFAAEQGADPGLCADVALAVSEAVTNAVKHSGAPEGETVSLFASVVDDWLEIRVLDRGTGFGTSESDGLGLGLTMIARLSARLTIRQEGQGTELSMSFALPRR
jgi:serine/threonine-protein kinase RsbW